jgi:iron complex outermembrane receptor protein
LKNNYSSFNQPKQPLRKKPLVLAVLCALSLDGHVHAQTADAAAPAADAMEKVVVTGTSIRGVDPIGSQTVHMDKADIAATGFTNISDVAKTLPQLQGLGFGEAPVAGQNGGNNTQRGSALNLRGLGTSATLLLVDGHRLAPTGTIANFTEANVVPVSALERIEVVADGASAIYGSDAVAGVVNYVLRRDFNGVEVSARGTTSKYWNEKGGNVLAGKTWSSLGGFGKGNVLVSFDYNNHDPFLQAKSPYLRQDVSQFGGNDARLQGNTITSGALANITVQGSSANTQLPNAGNFRTYTVPVGSTGTGLSASSLAVNQPSLTDTADYTDYLASSRRQQFVLLANQSLSDRVKASFQGFYSDRSSDSRNTTGMLATGGANQLVVPATSPFYITGIPGVAPGAPLNVQYNFYKDIGYIVRTTSNTNLSLTGELEAKLGAGWRGNVSYTLGKDTACGVCTDKNLNVAAAQAAVSAGQFNPFDTRPLPASVTSKFFGNNIQSSRNQLNDAVIKADGPLFDFGAGKVRAALGGEFTRTSMFMTNGANRNLDNAFVVDAATTLTRKVDSYFTELYVPLIGEAMAVPLVQKLSIDAAMRTERYSDFGRTTNPKLGVEWSVNDDLKVRGSWGKSFRAPSLADINPLVFSARRVVPIANNSGDPTLPLDVVGANLTNVMVYGGSTPDLKPETAKTSSIGFDLNPGSLPGLRLSMTYFNVNYKDQITGLYSQYNQYLASPANRQIFAPFIYATPAPANCVNSNPATFNPIVASFLKKTALFGNLADGVPVTNACGIRAVLDARNVNAGSTQQNGVDFSTGYDFQAGLNRWAIGGSFTYLLHVKMKLVPNSPEVDRVDTINNPVALRSRVSVSWANGPASANLFVNYVGSYHNNLPITIKGVQQPEAEVKGWPTMDLGLSYAFPQKDGLLSGFRASLNVQNVLNRQAPIVISTNGLAIDNQNANPYGRVATFQVAKKF